MPKKILCFEKTASFLIFLTLTSKLNLIIYLSSNCLTTGIVLLFLTTGILSVLGLFFGKSYGYISVYFFIPISVVGLGISTIPYVLNLIPLKYKTTAIFCINLIFFIWLLIINLFKKFKTDTT